MSSIFRASDTVIVLALLALGMTAWCAMAPPARSAEIPQIAFDSAAPMDGDFTNGPSSSDLVPFSQVAAMLNCDIFRGCDGHGDLKPFRPTTATVVCAIEDDVDCFSAVPWYRVEDSIHSYQDAGVILTQKGSEPILIAAN